MDGGPLQSTLRELRTHLADWRGLAIMAVIGVLLGLAGPFGSFEAIETLPRIAYWLATVFLTYGFGYAISSYADRAWGGGKPVWLRFCIMVVPAGLGASAIVALLNAVTFGTAQFDPGDIPVLVAQCFAVAAGVVAVMVLSDGRARPEPHIAADSRPSIIERVPVAQRGALIALIVEDHYVDIVTDRGKTLVLMRLADAIREAGAVPGLQIHRSHWVATGHVVKAHRSDGKLALELSNGMRLPVSRSYVAAVREAGFG